MRLDVKVPFCSSMVALFSATLSLTTLVGTANTEIPALISLFYSSVLSSVCSEKLYTVIMYGCIVFHGS